MKTIDLTHAPPDVAELLDQAGSADLLARLADGRKFFPVAVGGFDEIAGAIENSRLMALLEARAGQGTTVPQDEFERRLGLEGSDGSTRLRDAR